MTKTMIKKSLRAYISKRKKIRTVDFCDTLAAILREAKKEQMLNSIKYGPLYSQNYYRIVKEKNRTYYEVYSLPRTETPPEDYTQVSFVCLRPDGAYEAPATVSSVCRYSRKKIGDTTTDLKKMLIPAPPLELQNRFAAFVSEVDKSKLAVKQSLEKLETLKKSLMQQYFG